MNAILLAIILTTAMPPVEVQMLDGQTHVGTLVALTPDRVTIDATGGQTSFEIEKVVSIASRQKQASAPHRSVVVELVDGSTILASQYLTSGATAKLMTLDGDTIECPTNAVCRVRLQQESGSLRAEWSRLTRRKSDSDLLVVRKNDSLDYHAGVLHDVTDTTVTFEVEGETLPVKRSKVFGFSYRHADEANEASAMCRISDLSGSQWAVRALELAGKLQWTTPSGVTVAQAVEKIAQIDFSHGKIVYLSDLRPNDVRWTPYFSGGKPSATVEQFYSPRFDRGFQSETLSLGGKQYRKGVALHARAEVVYRLPDHFSHFRAIAGIDDATRPGGRVRLRIRGDEKELLDIMLTGADAPRPIDLNLTGVRRLAIVADFGETLSAGDYLLLCNARLSK